MKPRLCECPTCQEPCIFDIDDEYPDWWECRGCSEELHETDMDEAGWSEWEDES